MADKFSMRDRSILIGLYLSKFDGEGLQTLGFEGSREAFNTIGYAIGAKPASLKNYRDEFDPYFPNPRKGWHKRQLREYCKRFLDDFGETSFDGFTELVKSFIFSDYKIQEFVAKIEKKDFSNSIAKRLLTGIAAEEYFRSNYNSLNEFQQFSLTDTTKNACGFDFKLDLYNQFFCIEVKGLNTLKGSISLTEKEFNVAQNLKRSYCLFIVSNFIEKPIHQYYFDPLNSQIIFNKVERQITQVTYTSQI